MVMWSRVTYADLVLKKHLVLLSMLNILVDDFYDSLINRKLNKTAVIIKNFLNIFL